MTEPLILIKTIEVPTMKVSLRNDGIIQVQPDQGARIILKHVREEIEAIGLLGGGKKFPILVFSGADNTIETEVMNFVAREGSNPYALAEAYILSSISHKLLANFYLNINRPARPTRAFINEPDALKWLYPFLPAKDN